MVPVIMDHKTPVYLSDAYGEMALEFLQRGSDFIEQSV